MYIIDIRDYYFSNMICRKVLKGTCTSQYEIGLKYRKMWPIINKSNMNMEVI